MERTGCLYPGGRSPEGMVSASQLQCWMACPKRWEYAYRESLRPRVERPYLTVGRMCHAGMQAAMERLWRAQHPGADDPAGIEALHEEGERAVREEHARYLEGVDFLPEELPGFEQTLQDALDVFHQALDEFDPMRWEVLTVHGEDGPRPALELHFLVPCAWSQGLHGYIDAVLRDLRTGHSWCVDYKFRKTLEDDDCERYNVQNAIYMRACRAMGLDVVGSMTWQHSNRPAADPALTKGGVSRARIRTTWRRYREFVEANGLDPADYADMEEKLADVEWFRETMEYRSDDTVDGVWAEVVERAAHGILESGSGDNPRCMYSWNCRGCQFSELCQAELRGYDADWVRKTQYSRKGHRQ